MAARTKDMFTKSWIIENAVDVLSNYDPGVLTIRGLHYQLVSRGMTNDIQHYKRVVAATGQARWDGIIGFDAFSDRERAMACDTRAEETIYEEAVDRAKRQIKLWANNYCLNQWENQPIYVKNDLNKLDLAILSQPSIEGKKRLLIDSLYHAAAIDSAPYDTYKKLYEEYRSYNYDTALIYIHYMEEEASIGQMADAQLCRAFIYMSGGLFKEAADILEKWLSDEGEYTLDYYIYYTRLLWDLSDNAGGELGRRYNDEGIRLNQILQTYISTEDTMMYWYSRAVLDLRRGAYKRGIERCQKALSATPPSIHYKAIVASTLAYLYRQTNNNAAALHYYIEAAICDIQSSTYETVALRNIAELLYDAGEYQLADYYIRIAMQDAQRYNARYRQISIAQSMPIIEEQMLARLRFQQYSTIILLVIVIILLVCGIIGIVVLRRKNTILHTAQKEIDQMNRSLAEANKLKEELLGTLLASRSQYINTVQQYQQAVKQNAANRKWSELMSIPRAADARLQRTTLDHQIDTVILSIYPTFVEDFNALLPQKERIELKKGELLNAQLRIFALIRLGVTHNEVIAEILDYSINTVYNYKTRVIASSGRSPETFYAALMKIQSFVQ